MKTKMLLFIFICCLTMDGYSQSVSSDCDAPDSVVQKYFTDAQRLALRRILSSGSNYADSIRIPAIWTDTSLKALIAVYNATSLPARDTVIQFLDIHTWRVLIMTSLSVQIDTSYTWAHELSQGNLNTGNATLDGLTAEYGMTIYDIDNSQWGVVVVFTTDSNYNLFALSEAFETVPGVISAQSYGGAFFYIWDITESVAGNIVSLTYSYGWGDCPVGCVNRRFWQFNVDHDCNVEFAGSYGSLIDFPVPNLESASSNCEIKLYPNPTHENIIVECMEHREIFIENVNGQTILNFTAESPKEIISLLNFPCGMYIVRSYSPDGNYFTGKFIRD